MNSRLRWLALFALPLVAALWTTTAPASAAAQAAKSAQRHSVHPARAALPHISSRQLHGIMRAAPPSLVAPGRGGSKARDPIDLQVLVISADGNETDFPAIEAFLGQLGVPFNTLIATQTPLTSGMLWDGAFHGYYSGIILATGNLTYFNSATQQWQSAFNDAQWQTLWQYEALFGIRQVTSYTDPVGYPDTYGLQLVTNQDTTTAPLQASLTAAGQSIYSYLNPTSPVTFRNAWVYLATIQDTANTTPLLQTANGYTIASIHSYPDGRQNLAVTAANNPYLTHSMLLSYGVINWLTKGLFLGERHVQLDTTVDDLFIDDNLWNPPTLSDLCCIYRITGSDRSCSYPTALRLAVLSTKYLPAPGGRPSQRAANTRRKCPLENSRVFPSMARTRRTARSARAPICSGDSPPGQPSRNSCQPGRSAWISAVRRPSYWP